MLKKLISNTKQHLSHSSALHRISLHLGEVMVVGNHIGNDGLLIGVFNVHI